MTIFRCIHIAVLLALHLYAVTGFAETQKKYQWQGGLSLQRSEFDLREFDSDGRELVHESGGLLGLKGEVLLSNGDHYFSGELSFLRATIDYDGETQTGTLFRTDTQTDIIDGSLSAGDIVYRNGFLTYGISMGLGYRFWQRDVLSRDGVLGISEDNKWLYFVLNNSLNFRLNEKTTAEINVLYRDIISAKATSDPLLSGVRTNVNFNLRGGKSYQFGARLRHSLQNNIELLGGVTVDRWSFKRTDAARGRNVALPKNETQQIGLFLGAIMYF